MPRSAIIGNHVYFLREGSSIDSVTVASDAKPDNDPTTNWTNYKLGCVESASFSNNLQTTEVRCPVEDTGSGAPGGVYQTSDEFVRQINLEINLVIATLNPQLWQAIWMSGAITDGGGGSGSFVPLAASGAIKGWARLAQYDNNNLLVSTADFWSQLRLNGNVDFNEDVVKVPVTLKVFSNALNSGTLSSFF